MIIDVNKHYLIAEIGHNHQGKLETALKLIKEAKTSGANAVKFQKRDNKSLYVKSFYNQFYDNPHSFGRTYGEHREALEFNRAEYKELQSYAKEIGIDFFATAFDLKSFEFLEDLNVPGYKIASADLLNFPLQNAIAKSNKIIFLSTGGATLDDVKKAIDNIFKYNQKLILLHCTASYPSRIEDMNLNVILTYKNEFPKLIIGLSDHENGIDAATTAYMLGARVFEKHFTLDRSFKGSDHGFSLEPQGLSKLARNLNRIPTLLGSSEKRILDSEKKSLHKMLKSIVASEDLKLGTKIEYKNIAFKSPGGGLSPHFFEDIIGKKTKKNLKEDDLILFEDLED